MTDLEYALEWKWLIQSEHPDPLDAVATKFGVTRATVSQRLSKMRANGWELPRLHPGPRRNGHGVLHLQPIFRRQCPTCGAYESHWGGK